MVADFTRASANMLHYKHTRKPALSSLSIGTQNEITQQTRLSHIFA